MKHSHSFLKYYNSNHLYAVESSKTPKLFNFDNSMAWVTVSKALVRSINTAPVTLLRQFLRELRRLPEHLVRLNGAAGNSSNDVSHLVHLGPNVAGSE